jgi:sialidase-1
VFRAPPLGRAARKGAALRLHRSRFRLLCAVCACWARSSPPRSQGRTRERAFTSSGGYNTYRIPAIVATTNGTLLAFCEGRKTSLSDAGDIDLVLKRSTDAGDTWGALTIVQEEGDTATITIGNPVPVVDRQTGRIWLAFCRNNSRVFVRGATTTARRGRSAKRSRRM